MLCTSKFLACTILGTRTIARMGTIPNGHDSEGHNPEWTQSRMNTITNGHHSEWAPSKMDTIPNGHNPEWTQSRMHTIPNGHNSKWTPFRMDTIPNEHLPSILYANLVMRFYKNPFNKKLIFA